MDQALAIVRVANPKESEDSLRDLAKLLLDMRSLILKKKLTPCVRTKYNRVALQSSKNNNLRLTIDRNITMINERCEGAKAQHTSQHPPFLLGELVWWLLLF